VLQGITSAGK